MSSRGRSRSRSRDRGGSRGGGERISVLVRNLPLDVTGDEVRHLFGKYGPVRDVYLPKDYYSGRPKGFGFIEFTDNRDAEDAIYRLDRTMFGGRELNVCKSREGRKKPDQMREREEPSRRRGGGGSRRRSRSRSRSPRRRSRSRSRSGGRRRRSPTPERSRSPVRSRSASPAERHRSRSRSASQERSGSPPPPQGDAAHNGQAGVAEAPAGDDHMEGQ